MMNLSVLFAKIHQTSVVDCHLLSSNKTDKDLKQTNLGLAVWQDGRAWQPEFDSWKKLTPQSQLSLDLHISTHPCIHIHIHYFQLVYATKMLITDFFPL